jgi:2-polyprenyl-6-methoxyphenol hydroxylase-like FAD-dependent oxidoreductase
MRVAVAGAGPAGLMVSGALARRGHDVTVVDRDPGPGHDTWDRRGVMQFRHAHAFRPQVHEALGNLWPEALERWALTAEPISVPTPAGERIVGVLSRRSTFERALRAAVAETDGVDLVTGHVDRFVVEEDRVCGLEVDGATVRADLVVDATGRRGLRRRAVAGAAGDCGIAYVNRGYRLVPGAEPGPTTMPIGYVASFDGYQILLFQHEQGHFTVVFVRATADDDLCLLHETAGFEAACRAVPALALWTDPERSAPTTEVMVGGALRNVYRAPRTTDGLVAVGDAVATTTPTAGRGIALAALQVQALARLLDERAGDPGATDDAVRAFDAWCDEQVRPWVDAHVEADTAQARHFRGADVDPERLTAADIAAIADADPSLMPVVGPYLGMAALPQSLEPLRDRARELYASGWRPAYGEGPSRDRLVEVVRRAVRG